MKPSLTFLLLFFLLSFIQAQEITVTDIPKAVIDRFTLLYPDAKNTVWEKQFEIYKADFKNDKMATQAFITASGDLYRTETEIKVTALPEAATTFLTQKVVAKKIEEATIIEDVTGIITFEAKADKVDYRFDGNGQLLGPAEMVVGSKYN